MHVLKRCCCQGLWQDAERSAIKTQGIKSNSQRPVNTHACRQTLLQQLIKNDAGHKHMQLKRNTTENVHKLPLKNITTAKKLHLTFILNVINI